MTQTSMMSLGLFVFRLDTLPFNRIVRQTKYLWSSKQSIGVGPNYQFIGLGGSQITISGHLVPPITGGLDQIQIVRDMAEQGKSWLLVSGIGEELGAWFIDDIQDTGIEFTGDGQPQYIQFDLKLTLALDLNTLGLLENSA